MRAYDAQRRRSPRSAGTGQPGRARQSARSAGTPPPATYDAVINSIRQLPHRSSGGGARVGETEHGVWRSPEARRVAAGPRCRHHVVVRGRLLQRQAGRSPPAGTRPWLAWQNLASSEEGQVFGQMWYGDEPNAARAAIRHPLSPIRDGAVRPSRPAVAEASTSAKTIGGLAGVAPPPRRDSPSAADANEGGATTQTYLRH